MKKFFKYLVTHLYKPLLVKYLGASRSYSYRGLRLIVPPEVFHPGFFFSTRLLLRHISALRLKERAFLELGAGSGLISLFAAREGARATATDINPAAVKALEQNRAQNGLSFQIIHSDLFSNIPPQAFDIIAINPPYYRKQPNTYAEYAWYCGENGEYFTGLFGGLKPYIGPGAEARLILCDGCDMDMVHTIAGQHGWQLQCVETRRNWIEKNYIFKIEPAPAL